jgi:hypothetical protein
MSDIVTLVKLILDLRNSDLHATGDIVADAHRDIAFEEAADMLEAAITPDLNKVADPDGKRFEAQQRVFTSNGIFEMSTDRDAVTISTHAYEQIAQLLREKNEAEKSL